MLQRIRCLSGKTKDGDGWFSNLNDLEVPQALVDQEIDRAPGGGAAIWRWRSKSI